MIYVMVDCAAIPASFFLQSVKFHLAEGKVNIYASPKTGPATSKRHCFFGHPHSWHQHMSQVCFHKFAREKAKTMSVCKIACNSPRSYSHSKSYGNAAREFACRRKHLSRKIKNSSMHSGPCLCHSNSFSSHSSVSINQNFNAYKSRKGGRDSTTYKCCRAVTNLGGIMTLEWNYVVDELLLAATIVLAYFAGVITYNPPYLQNNKDTTRTNKFPMVDKSGSSYVKEEKTSDAANVWNTVEQKLLEALEGVGIDDQDSDFLVRQESKTNCVLSLQAISKGPRLRLLWRTLCLLRREVDKFRTSNKNIEQEQHAELLFNICRTSSGSVYEEWISAENSLRQPILSESSDCRVILPENFEMSKFIEANINSSSKKDLHAELLFFLCFDLVTNKCFASSIAKHAVDILEDLVIFLADGIAALYLEITAMEGSTSDAYESMNILHPSFMSSRSLERFRNEVALHKWFDSKFYSVTAIYEDRFDLWTFHSIVKNPVGDRKGYAWLKKRKSKMKLQGNIKEIIICQMMLQVRRTKELRALRGWRYYYSIMLEISDILTPLVREIVTKVGNCIAFLLVTLIGRSLGLVYRGIRQSLNWKS